MNSKMARPNCAENYIAQIPIKKSSDVAKLPTRGSNYAAGYDLYSTEDYTLKPLERKLFKTGISMAIPGGLYGRIAPRSGLAYKDGIDTMAGVIDEDYRGDVGVILINLGNVDKTISIGDKIAQIIFENYTAAIFQEFDALPESNRGEGGFGSTDVKTPPPQPIPELPVIKEELQIATGKSLGRTYPNELIDKEIKKYEEAHLGKTLSELYEKAGGIPIKKRYIDEVKERQKTE